MSRPFQFSLDRGRVLTLAACFAGAGLLIFVAGSLAGILYTYATRSDAHASSVPPIAKAEKAAVASVKAPALPAAPKLPEAGSTGGAAAASSPASSGAQSVASAVAPVTAPASSPGASSGTKAGSSDASAASKPAADSGSASGKAVAVHEVTPVMPHAVLAVRVGSFSSRGNADALAQSLNDMGYRPTIGQFTDGRGRHWYVVKLGPYKRWNTASAVATRISIAENVSPVIGPMR